jgi:hypothetical protein
VRELLRDRGMLLKFELLQKGVGAAEATAQVVAALEKKSAPKPKRQQPSKKAQAKAGAAAS